MPAVLLPGRKVRKNSLVQPGGKGNKELRVQLDRPDLPAQWLQECVTTTITVCSCEQCGQKPAKWSIRTYGQLAGGKLAIADAGRVASNHSAQLCAIAGRAGATRHR